MTMLPHGQSVLAAESRRRRVTALDVRQRAPAAQVPQMHAVHPVDPQWAAAERTAKDHALVPGGRVERWPGRLQLEASR